MLDVRGSSDSSRLLFEYMALIIPTPLGILTVIISYLRVHGRCYAYFMYYISTTISANL